MSAIAVGFLSTGTIKVISMRIGHVAPLVYPVPPRTYGGTERVIADLAKAQVQQGHEVVLFGSSDSAVDGVSLVGGQPSLGALGDNREEVPPGVLAELEAAQLRDLLQFGSQCDVLHLHGPAQTSAVANHLDIPIFRTIHWRADELDHAIHFQLFPNEKVIAISEKQAVDIPPSVLAGTVYHGIPLNRYAVGNGGGKYLAFLGRMTDQKRPDRAIELAQRCALPLQLAGPIDPGNPNYFRDVVEPKLVDKIEYIGSITDLQKQAFLGHAAALVFPIDWPEPFGLVMIEAMACGTPVIAWRNGSVDEVVDDGVTGVIVNSLDEAVSRLEEALSLDRNAIRRRFEDRFGVDRMAREIVALYEKASTIL